MCLFFPLLLVTFFIITNSPDLPLRTKEEEDAQLFVSASNDDDDDIQLGSDDEGEDEDEKAHLHLLNDMKKISKRKK